MDRLKHSSSLLLGLLLMLTSAEAGATLVEQMPFEDLANRSAAVVVVYVEEVDVTYGVSTAEEPATRVLFTVEDTLGGGEEAPEQLEYVLPEGQFPDGRFMETVGTPKFLPGQRWVLFLRAESWYRTPVTNYWHGAFREVQLSAGTFYASSHGMCVSAVTETGIHPGWAIDRPVVRPLMVADGTQLYAVPETSDDGEDEATYEANAENCLTATEFMAELDNSLQGYTLDPEQLQFESSLETSVRSAVDTSYTPEDASAEPLMCELYPNEVDTCEQPPEEE